MFGPSMSLSRFVGDTVAHHFPAHLLFLPLPELEKEEKDGVESVEEKTVVG